MRRLAGRRGDEALHRGEVRDEIVDVEPVDGDGVHVGGVDPVGHVAQELRGRVVGVDARRRACRRARRASVEAAHDQSRNAGGGVSVWLAPYPGGRGAQSFDVALTVGVRDEELLDRGGFVGIDGVERERAQQVVEGIGADHAESSIPCASMAPAILRNARRRRDFAVPSGIPSSSAT